MRHSVAAEFGHIRPAVIYSGELVSIHDFYFPDEREVLESLDLPMTLIHLQGDKGSLFIVTYGDLDEDGIIDRLNRHGITTERV